MQTVLFAMLKGSSEIPNNPRLKFPNGGLVAYFIFGTPLVLKTQKGRSERSQTLAISRGCLTSLLTPKYLLLSTILLALFQMLEENYLKKLFIWYASG